MVRAQVCWYCGDDIAYSQSLGRWVSLTPRALRLCGTHEPLVGGVQAHLVAILREIGA